MRITKNDKNIQNDNTLLRKKRQNSLPNLSKKSEKNISTNTCTAPDELFSKNSSQAKFNGHQAFDKSSAQNLRKEISFSMDGNINNLDKHCDYDNVENYSSNKNNHNKTHNYNYEPFKNHPQKTALKHPNEQKTFQNGIREHFFIRPDLNPHIQLNPRYLPAKQELYSFHSYPMPINDTSDSYLNNETNKSTFNNNNYYNKNNSSCRVSHNGIFSMNKNPIAFENYNGKNHNNDNYYYKNRKNTTFENVYFHDTTHNGTNFHPNHYNSNINDMKLNKKGYSLNEQNCDYINRPKPSPTTITFRAPLGDNTNNKEGKERNSYINYPTSF